jgi:SAM-dependent methyltransferase
VGIGHIRPRKIIALTAWCPSEIQRRERALLLADELGEASCCVVARNVMRVDHRRRYVPLPSALLTSADRSSMCARIYRLATRRRPTKLHTNAGEITHKVIGSARLSLIRRRVRSLPGASRLATRVNRHRSERLVRQHLERLERANDAPQLAKSRWRATAPGPELTWGKRLTGDAFVERAMAHHAFGPDRTVLEIGPGYGRILRTCLERSVPFRRWVGLDLSAENVRHLSREFPDPRIEFVQGDAESARLDTPVDTVISSLTFKHLYPSFELALRNIAGQLSERGLVLFDLIEGSGRNFESDEVTYVRQYSRKEVRKLLARVALELVGFDTVAHDRDHVRLLVVAAATGDGQRPRAIRRRLGRTSARRRNPDVP